MVKTSVGNAGFALGSRDAGLASALSLLPGLGQIYNGQARKGLLFLATTASYLFVFLLIIFNQGLIDGLNGFGQSFHMKPDFDLIYALHELYAGSILSFIVSALFIGFVVYAVKDAYEYASYLQNKYIYADYALEITEATSGSYLLHFTGIIVLFLLAVFYLQHTQRQSQVTCIEFVQDQQPTKKKIVSARASSRPSENAGQHQNKPIVAPSHHATDIVKTATPPLPKFHPVIARTTPLTLTPRQLISPPIRPPLPTTTALNHPGVPTVNQINNKTKSIMPQPSLSDKNKAAQAFTPQLNNGPAIPTSAGGQIPVPASAHSGSNNNFIPAPIAIGDAPPGKNSAARPLTPIQAGSPNSHMPGIAVKPVIPGLTGAHALPAENIEGNPAVNINSHGPSNIEAMPINFGPYMNDLQRRIKRAWNPFKEDASKRVIVLFKIHKLGELSDLHLQKSSGSDRADRAALKAVEDAAPFLPLPKGASDDVDIQFTFDYNVFSGTSRLFKGF